MSVLPLLLVSGACCPSLLNTSYTHTLSDDVTVEFKAHGFLPANIRSVL